MLKSLWALALLLLASTLAAADATPGVSVGKTAPALQGTSVDGAFDLMAFQKKHPDHNVVVIFSRAHW